MNPEPSTALEQLHKSIQTFDNLAMAAESRDKLYRYNDALMQSLYSILDDKESDEQTKLQFLDDTLSQYAEAMKELFPKLISVQNPTGRPVVKADQNRFDEIVEVEKFNPYHDELGRFSTANRYDQFTITTRDPSKQHLADAAIAREKDREARGLVFGPKIKDKSKDKPKPQEKPEETTEANLPAPAPTSTKTILPTKAVATCQDVEAKSVKLKNEKLTLVNENGDIIHERRGGRSSVSIDNATAAKMGEGVTLTHNHPGEFGGTFSGADVNILTKYSLTGIRAVGVEGTYSLERRSNTTGLKASMLNGEYRKLADYANSNLRSEYKKLKLKAGRGDITVEEANKQLQEYRAKECNKMHDWLTQNAATYGFNYVFTPSSGGVTKMFDIEKEEAEETTGELMLDGEFISGDNWLIKDDESDD